MDAWITGALDLHFLRPWWFVGFLPLGIMIFLLIRQRVGSKSWEAICDPHLLPHLLVGSHGGQSRGPYILLATVWSLCLVALAGPVWSKLPQPVFRAQSALVLVLDLSRSMDAEDMTPSRLTRAKHKTLDILKRRQEGQIALVVFAGEPYVVSPLTEDAQTIAAMVSSLDTDIMPLQGSRSDLALLQAEKLFTQSDIPRGQILLITDGVEESHAQEVVNKLLKAGHQLSVLGVGTAAGAPIPQSQGFVKDKDGVIVIPTLDSQVLRELAKHGQGRYATLTIDDQDLETVLPSDWEMTDEQQDSSTQRTTDLWREEGPWIVLGIVALTIPAFRSGWLGILLLMILLTPTHGEAFFEKDWWNRPDQQGARALEQEDPETAATLFEDSSWKGVANYRAGNFENAAENFSQDSSVDGHFNRGNALARAGQLQEALQAYQTALKQDPDHEDAQHNYELIEKLLEQQDPQENSDSKVDPSEDQESSESEQSEDEPSQESGEQQEGQQESEDAEGQSSQDKEQADSQSSSGSSEESEANTDLAQQDNGKNDPGEEEDPSQDAGNLADESEADPSDDDNQQGMTTAGLSKEEKKELESQQATEQWLRRIPDDPGGLLRRKFLFEHRRRQESGQFNTSGGQGW